MLQKLYKIVTTLTRAQKQLFFLLMDSAAIAIAFFAALMLTGQMTPDLPSALQIAPMLAVIASPFPEPPRTMPRSAVPSATESAAGLMKSG